MPPRKKTNKSQKTTAILPVTEAGAETFDLESIEVGHAAEQQVSIMAREGAHRATPAMDGLKPVQRRILFAAERLGLKPNRPAKKSAAVVGEVLGKYHPHGDQSVYDAMVRMTQPWNTRYPLMEPLGNFGSIAGDGPAAMRYTETRLTELGEYLLRDLDLGYWIPNFDESTQEPWELPPVLPYLLLGHISGISHAAESASWPGHNINEVLDAVIAIANDPKRDWTVNDLMQYIIGPDLPTGGILYRYNAAGEDVIAKAYAQAADKESIVLQPLIHLEKGYSGQVIIEFRTPPNQSSAENLQASLNKLRQNERLPAWERDAIEGVSAAQNLSSGHAFRYRIVVKKAAKAGDDRVTALLKMLFKRQPVRGYVPVNFVVNHSNLHDNYMLPLTDPNAVITLRPRRLTLVEYLTTFVELRMQLIRLRAARLFRENTDRRELLEAAAYVTENQKIFDKVVKIVRASRKRAEAIDGLTSSIRINRKPMTKRQAEHILDMGIWKLSRLEIEDTKKALTEYTRRAEQARKTATDLNRVRTLLIEEMEDAKARFGDERRTLIVDAAPSDLPLVMDDSDPTLAPCLPRVTKDGKIIKPKKKCK